MTPAVRLAVLLSLAPAAAAAQGDAGAAGAAGPPADPREAFVWELKNLPRLEVLAKTEAAVVALGTYRYKMKKQERVDGKLLDMQEIVATVQDTPFAIRMDYAAGPGKGRIVLYNPAIKAERFRVRETGFFSIVGAIWLDVDSGFAKKESKHTVKDGGLGNLARRFARDVARGQAEGGFVEKQEGWNNAGSWCALYLSPNRGKGYDSFSTRLCTDPLSRFPTKVEAFDENGLLHERYEFSDVEKITLPKDYFTLEGAGL